MTAVAPPRRPPPPPPPTAGDLGARAARGTVAALASQAFKFAVNVGVAIALARLLTPEDFGVFAIAFAATGFLEFAREGGMVVAVVQSETLTREQTNTLFWFNAGVGALLTLVALAAAPVIGRAFSDPRLVPVAAVLALTFLASGLCAQHSALLRRQMRFTAIAACELTALAVAAAVGVAAATRGAGYWALVSFNVVLQVVQAALVIAAAGWRPAWPERWAPVAPLVRFGGVMMAFDLVGYFNQKFDNLIVAWFLGPAALGLYDKAYQFLLMPVNQISLPLSGVVHSTLSRLQRDPERYRAYLARAVLLSTGLGLPLTAFLYANAHTIITQLLGRQWLPAAPIFSALAPAAATMTVTACVGWIFLSLGRARRQLPWAAFTTAITVAAFVVGARWGVVGVAAAFSVSRVVLLPATLMYTCAGTPVAWTEVLATAGRPAVASLAALPSSLAMDALMPAADGWTLPRNAAAFAFVYCLCWVLLPGGRALLRDNLAVARLVLHGRA